LKQIFIVIIILFLWFHVKDGRNNSRKSSQTCPKKSEFGFVYSDFNVVHDTEKGDTWNFIEEQNIGNRQVYDIIAKVKDSFDVRTIRMKAFTMLRSKTRRMICFIYQPDNLSYVVDLEIRLLLFIKK
jgi:hypothetical protein